ncbi:N/A [soil metagenome]
MSQFTVEDIKTHLGKNWEILGDPSDKYFTEVKSIFEASKESLVWVNSTRRDRQQLIEKTEAAIIICDRNIDITDNLRRNKCLVIVDSPKLIYLRIVAALFSTKMKYGTHPSAVIEPEAEIHSETYIGPYTYIGRSRIGKGSIVHGHCHICDGVIIGERVFIDAGTVVGSEGFGFAKNEAGKWERFPHIGGVVIHDDVEIGANTCVARGTLGNTEIREGAKIDCHVQVSHNVIVGKGAIITAFAVISGSSIIGDNAWIAPGAVITDGITIGQSATVGPGAVVLSSVPDFAKVVGKPAMPLPREYWNKS